MKSYQMDQRTCSLAMEWLDMSNSSTAIGVDKPSSQSTVYSALQKLVITTGWKVRAWTMPGFVGSRKVILSKV